MRLLTNIHPYAQVRKSFESSQHDQCPGYAHQDKKKDRLAATEAGRTTGNPLSGEDVAAGMILGEDAGDEVITGLAEHPLTGRKKQRLLFFSNLLFDELGFFQDLRRIEAKPFLIGLNKTKFAGGVYRVGKKSRGGIICFF